MISYESDACADNLMHFGNMYIQSSGRIAGTFSFT